MVPLPMLFELYDYHYWARDRQLNACLALTKRQFLQPMNSSFSSLRDTLAHMAAAEWVWLERWRGRSPREMPAAEQFPTVESIGEYWRRIEHEVREYLTTLNAEGLEQPLSYVNFQGESWTYPLWRTLLHVANHATYHRGQVTTLLRQLGAEPPPVDFLVAHDMGFRS